MGDESCTSAMILQQPGFRSCPSELAARQSLQRVRMFAGERALGRDPYMRYRRRHSPPDLSIGLNACILRRVDAIAASLVLAWQDWLGNGDGSACARRCG